jgi:hypothetical protein
MPRSCSLDDCTVLCPFPVGYSVLQGRPGTSSFNLMVLHERASSALGKVWFQQRYVFVFCTWLYATVSRAHKDDVSVCNCASYAFRYSCLQRAGVAAETRVQCGECDVTITTTPEIAIGATCRTLCKQRGERREAGRRVRCTQDGFARTKTASSARWRL